MDSYLAKAAALAGESVGEVWESILINSLELHTPRWTSELFEQFEARRGYDLRPYLHIYLKYAPQREVDFAGETNGSLGEHGNQAHSAGDFSLNKWTAMVFRRPVEG